MRQFMHFAFQLLTSLFEGGNLLLFLLEYGHQFVLLLLSECLFWVGVSLS